MKINHLYKNRLRKALAMSYDDGDIRDRRLVEIFNKYGVKGTFHLNAGITENLYRISAKEAAELHRRPHNGLRSVRRDCPAFCGRNPVEIPSGITHLK